ncbi:hypothetical protein [Primorskyibacter sp. 2E107]|uniref:hypothetical protein n=1 Tax=Primorskyibacter sp. 2E107 TaxID=3403458 RepID=UPI003AF74EF4
MEKRQVRELVLRKFGGFSDDGSAVEEPFSSLDDMAIVSLRAALRKLPDISPSSRPAEELVTLEGQSAFLPSARALISAWTVIQFDHDDSLTSAALQAAFGAGAFSKFAATTAATVTAQFAAHTAVLPDRTARMQAYVSLLDWLSPEELRQVVSDCDEVDFLSPNNIGLNDYHLWNLRDRDWEASLKSPLLALRKTEYCVFWYRWFEGFMRGEPLDWELQRRVALIDDAIWQAGAEAVADEIARIEVDWRAERAANANRAPEFEPDNVAFLFDYPKSVVAQVSVASTAIVHNFEVFRRETGLNQTPEVLEPLEAIPASLSRIGDILASQARSDASEQAMREEIGRLGARVAELERALAEANTRIRDLEGQSWKRIAAMTVGGANLFGVLAAAVWTVSGDDIGARKRLETLLEYRDTLFGGAGDAVDCVPVGVPMTDPVEV